MWTVNVTINIKIYFKAKTIQKINCILILQTKKKVKPFSQSSFINIFYDILLGVISREMLNILNQNRNKQTRVLRL